MRKLSLFRAFCSVVVFYAAATVVSSAQTLTTLASFAGTNGANSQSSLIQGTDGNFYGTTSNGGTNNAPVCQTIGYSGCGTVFRMTPGGTLTTLYSFCAQSNCTDGANPYGGLVQATDGNFYGTTYQGGAIGNCGGLYGCGTIFKITPGGTLTTLYSFCAQSRCTDGNFPYAGLVQGGDGNLYGTTSGGGAGSTYCPSGCGTVFKVILAGTLTTLHSFDNVDDGYEPSARLVQATDGNFYGTTPAGGGNGGGGTVFKITPGGTLTTLYSFCAQILCTDGNSPHAGLVQGSDGDFYGTTVSGGALEQSGNGSIWGTVFKITPGGTLTTLYSFCSPSCTGEAQPRTGLVQGTDGNLYGTLFGAGSYGVVYQITPSGTLTILHRFNGTDGGNPAAGLIQETSGTFYGTTTSGGANGFGTVFSLEAPAPLTIVKGGTGTVTSSDGNINCGAQCSYNYSLSTLVTLNAEPGPGNRLSSWIGCDTVNGTTCEVTVNHARYVGAIFAEAATDFNGDLTSDILWRNVANGVVVDWTMSAGTIQSSQWVYTVPDQNWQIVGTGDFDGDGKADVLWRNMANGAVVIWFMNGATIKGSAAVYTPDLTWQVAGVGDFNADGKADILWRNTVNGAVVMWLMNGASIASSALVDSPSLSWQIIRLGDFNGDGATDILWRNTADGTVLAWFMFGATIEASSALATVPDPNWQVAGTGDLNGDGATDILWQNKASGAVVAWLMNNGTITASQWVYNVADPNWQIARLGDFNGDGKTDVLWRNSTNGAIVAWFMNGATIAGSQFVYSVPDPNWHLY